MSYSTHIMRLPDKQDWQELKKVLDRFAENPDYALLYEKADNLIMDGVVFKQYCATLGTPFVSTINTVIIENGYIVKDMYSIDCTDRLYILQEDIDIINSQAYKALTELYSVFEHCTGETSLSQIWCDELYPIFKKNGICS